MSLDERYRAPQSNDAALNDSDAPALWNPNAAALWSLLFLPVFGATLHMLNARAMGDKDQIRQSKWALIVLLVIFLLLPLVTLFFNPKNNTFGLILLLGWYFAIGRKQVEAVKQQYGGDYPRKSWLKPLALAVLGVAVYLAYAVVVAFLIASIFPEVIVE
ncbi:hypothetical protein [Kingella pumchi]|uniref:Uncharacterized protein n=1 Tax=Kingella pumchi TaxID=2779506 RepID=A0ABS9NLG3_9NEIS|nr:hypothetical protein [Kingella pumchi]MCG6503626.1 hypothetical protein [Kingella pumchi]